MRYIEGKKIFNELKRLCLQANYYLPEDVIKKIQNVYKDEISDLGKFFLKQIIENYMISLKYNIPLCQDTGIVHILIQIGNEVHIEGNINEIVNSAVESVYSEAGFRKSICNDPLNANNYSFAPAIINLEYIKGEKMVMNVLIKGGGCENSCRFFSLSPSAGYEGLKKKILDTVKDVVPYTCPPVIIGIGIGGSFDYTSLLSKKALLRDLNKRNAERFYANLETELLNEINSLGIGPQACGGEITALAVNIEYAPAHIATLPVAINISCHSLRKISTVI